MNNTSSSERIHRFSCVACQSERILEKWQHKGREGSRSVVWCRNCGLGSLHPFPTVEEYYQLYSGQPAYGIEYRNESHGGFPVRIKRLAELMPQRGRLLDIGSGLGYFLKIAKEDGWLVEGIEPSSAAVRYCYDTFAIRVHEGFLEDFYGLSGVYDVVTLWDVLEHVSDHIQFLERSIDLLAPGGILVLAIPNASGWPARLFRGRWRYVMPTHRHYFKMPYITKVLAEKKLDIERADHTLKIHSLIQGVLSFLPFKVNRGRVFKIGMKAVKSDNIPVTALDKKRPQESLLTKVRRIAFKFNMMALPGGIGDMVDLYCRKGS